MTLIRASPIRSRNDPSSDKHEIPFPDPRPLFSRINTEKEDLWKRFLSLRSRLRANVTFHQTKGKKSPALRGVNRISQTRASAGSLNLPFQDRTLRMSFLEATGKRWAACGAGNWCRWNRGMWPVQHGTPAGEKAPKTTYRMKEGADRSTMMGVLDTFGIAEPEAGREFVKGALSQR